VFLATRGAVSQMLGDGRQQSLGVPPLELGLDILVEERVRLSAGGRAVAPGLVEPLGRGLVDALWRGR
jgi:hypothetical protein